MQLPRTQAGATPPTLYELRFPALHAGTCFGFPCTAIGAVLLDQLSERARTNYFFAQAMVGLRFGCPSVVPVGGAS